MQKILLFLLIGSICYSFSPTDDIQESIRRRVENNGFNSLQVAGEKLKCTRSLPEFYQKRVFVSAWNDSSRIAELINAINLATEEGLKPSDYHIDKLESMNKIFRLLSVQQRASLDLLATDAFLLYTSHLSSGKVNPASISAEWNVRGEELNPIEILEMGVESGDILKAINDLLPKHKIYQSMKEALRKYSSVAAKGGWQSVPEGETLKKDMESERVVAVRKRLAATGDLDTMAVESAVYDDALFEAVKKFQKRYGLTPDGEIGKETIAAMNISVEDRIGQIKVNLERWRWLPQDYGEYYIKVNIADFTLEIVKKGEVVRRHKAIVGKNYRETPVFRSKMTYLVLNPTWTVPPTILNNDVLPAVRKNVSYLKQKNMAVIDGKGNTLDPAAIDWNSPTVKNYTYRQSPGPDNALGAVKFMFPNPYSVYIHDTPSKELFDKTDRSLSSGCVRVEDPLEMAEYLINDKEKWSLDKIKKHITTKQTLTIPLTEQADVYVLYWTAWTNDMGEVQFRKDIYSRDKAVLEALDK